VIETERRWVEAHRDLNVADIEEILDEAYKRIQANDTEIGKTGVVASYRSGKRHWSVAEGSDYAVRVIDDVALVTGTWRGASINHGEVFDYRARFLAVYIKRADGWKLFRDEVLEFKQ
jgi:ketosteroid isomerase-like protein